MLAEASLWENSIGDTVLKRIRSLLLVEEKLIEAEYFARRLPSLNDPEIVFELNAYSSAARSVTWLIEKELSGVEGFAEWYGPVQEEMKSDPGMRFFKKIRDFSLHRGRVSLTSTRRTGSVGEAGWRHMFTANEKEVPAQLLGREVSECCLGHLAKLATVVLRVADAFPYDSCPSRAVTAEGLKHLGLEISDALGTLGCPPGWSDSMPGDTPIQHLARLFDWVDFDEIRRISQYQPPVCAEKDSDRRFAQSLAKRFGKPLQSPWQPGGED